MNKREPFFKKYSKIFLTKNIKVKIHPKILKYLYSNQIKVLINALSKLTNGWLLGVYGISTIVGYLTPNPFLYK